MRTARRLAGAMGLLATLYVAAPYITLYRLGAAIRDGDEASLETLVDWDQVREGIKEDICDASAEQDGAEQPASAALPEFGSSFMRGIAVNMIDKAVSAPALVLATRAQPGIVSARADSEPDPQPRVAWAFFDTPTTFSVLLQPPGAAAQPVRIQLGLRHGEWRVVRAWLPTELLAPQGDRT